MKASTLTRIFLTFSLFAFFFSCQSSDKKSSADKKKAVEEYIGHFNDPESLEKQYQQYLNHHDFEGQTTTLLHLAESYFNLGLVDKSKAANLKLYQLVEHSSDTLDRVECILSLARYYRKMTQYEEAIGVYYEAQDLLNAFSQKDDPMVELNQARIDYGMGSMLIRLSALQVADSALHQSFNHFRNLNDSTGEIGALNALAQLYISNGLTDSVEYFTNQAFLMSQKHSYLKGKVESLINLADYHMLKGDFKMALNQSQQADNWANTSHMIRLKLDARLALIKAQLKLGDLSQVAYQLSEAENTAKNINNITALARIHELYYLYYNKTRNESKALASFIAYKNYTDSVADLALLNQVSTLRSQHLSNKLSMEKQQAEVKLQHNRMGLGAAFLFILLLISGTIYLFRNLRERKKKEILVSNIQKSRETFFVNLAHEFRTPLTLIMGYADELKGSSHINSSQLETIGNTISNQGKSLLNLVNQLLDIVRVKSTTHPVNWRHGNISAYIGMVVESFQHFAITKQQSLRYMPQEEEIDMDFDPEYMEKIVKNLISNAMKFTPVDGSIQVKTSMDGKGNLMLVVSDTGTGIDPAHLTHLFEPFFQAEGPNRKLGSGLGLPIVEQLVTGMGGKISVESQLEKGSTFTVVIPLKHGTEQYKPLSESSCNYMTENIQSEVHELQSDDAGYSTNILIVEDNVDVANYIVHLLDNQYGIMLATSGESALEKASFTIPSLIITDVMMPGMDGFDFCRQIRQNSLLSHIPVIVLTAKVEDIDRIHSFEVGADAYVPKPFKAAELLTRVQNLLLQRKQLQEKYTRAIMDEESSKIPINQSDRKLMDHLTDIIYSLMKEGEVDVERIAEKMQMSTSQFRRKVEAVTGESPIQHINRIRMIYAKHLLESDLELKVYEVGLKCGFSDNAYFSRTFKQFYHQSPTEYRKSLLRKI